MPNVPLRKIVSEAVKKAGKSVDDYCMRKIGDVEADMYAGRIDADTAMREVERWLKDGKCYLESWDYKDIRKEVDRHLK